jgi:dipeptidyl aminopeptidase/acylaminoacyl peptidase
VNSQSFLQGDEPVPEDVYGSWSASPSPDGERVAFISDRSGEPAVWIQGPMPPRLAKLPTGPHRVLTVSWSPDGEWLACYTAAAGSSRNEIWVVRPDGGDLHLVAGADPGTAVLGAGAHHGWTADGRLVVTETVDVESSGLLIDPATGDRQTIGCAPLLVVLDVNPAAGRALLRFGPRGYRHLLVVDLDGSHERPVITGAGPGSVDRGCLSADGRTVYARSDVDRELAALIAVDIDPVGGRPPRVLAERTDAELEEIVPAADGSSAVLVWNVHGGTSAVSLLDLTTGREDQVTALPRDVVDECRFHPGGKALLLTAEDWADPRGVWTIDLTSGDATPLSSRADGALRGSRGASAATVELADLTRPQLRTFSSKDGTVLTGWLYRPDSPPPWPTMIHLHGGPEAQERPVYNSLFQSLVAAEIAVFAPNVRGSTGFGRTFVTADDRDRRYGAIEDVAATVAHLVETGVADAHRVEVRAPRGRRRIAAGPLADPPDRQPDRAAVGGARSRGHERAGRGGPAGRRRAGRTGGGTPVPAVRGRGSRTAGHPEPGGLRPGRGRLGRASPERPRAALTRVGNAPISAGRAGEFRSGISSGQGLSGFVQMWLICPMKQRRR